MAPAAALTVGEALARFRRANGLGTNESTARSWTCRCGPVTLRLPNFAWRRKAILAHDLHHVLTGYPCTMRGEFQMAAWEFGAGRMPHPGATLFCLPLVAIGFFWSPRRIFLAFMNGRRSRSLHRSAITDDVLGAPLPTMRAALADAACRGARCSDYGRLGLLAAQACAIVLSPIAMVIAAWIALVAG